MSFKLPVEKKHRRSKGGTHPGKIQKGVPFGRVIRAHYDADTDQMVLPHATRGVRRRNRAAYMAGEEIAALRR